MGAVRTGPPLWLQPWPIVAFPKAPLRQPGRCTAAFAPIPVQEILGFNHHLAAIQEYLTNVSQHPADYAWLNTRISDRLVEKITLHRWDWNVIPHAIRLLG